jgi:hypothetical protein
LSKGKYERTPGAFLYERYVGEEKIRQDAWTTIRGRAALEGRKTLTVEDFRTGAMLFNGGTFEKVDSVRMAPAATGETRGVATTA